MWDLANFYAPGNRAKLLVVAGALIAAIAIVDELTGPDISIGFLYLFPLIIVGGCLSVKHILGVALLCAILQEQFSPVPSTVSFFRLLFSSVAFAGTGLFVSELLRNRRIVLKNVEELENQIRLRQDAEEQLQFLVESSPAAIVIIDSNGIILLANEAAQQLLGSAHDPIQGKKISSYLPSLQTVAQSHASRPFRTSLQCRGQKSGGEAFLAGIWFSTYGTISGRRLAAVIVDLSEDLRDREDLSLEYLLKNSRILMSAVAHEIRNLCGTALVVQKNLSRLSELSNNEDFQALTMLIQSLEKISASELKVIPAERAGAVEVTSVLDELRVLIESAYHESDMEIEWEIQERLPLVRADRYGLVQVFLNIAKNSQRAMQASETKKLSVSASTEASTVIIRFEDTGVGISSPEALFRPFQSGADSSGLGLYLSRAITRSFGGELVYESRARGCCFAVVLPAISSRQEAIDVRICKTAH